jgi:hypothetical protein
VSIGQSLTAATLAALVIVPVALRDGSPASAQPTAPECGATELGNASFGEPVDVAVELTAANADASELLPRTEARRAAIRFLLSADPRAGANWTLEFRDEGLRLLDRIEASDFAEGRAEMWTGRFGASQANAHLLGAQPGDLIRIEKAIVYRAEDETEMFSVLGTTNDIQSLHGDTESPAMGDLRVARIGDSVGMMVASGLDPQVGSKSWCCSGVMLSPTLFLTNWHCGGNAGLARSRYWDKGVNASVLIDLAWDAGGRNRQYRSEEVLYTNPRMDIAILRVTPTRGGTGDDIGALGATLGRDPVANDQGVVIHHPLCLPKMASVTNCKVGKVGVPGWKLAGGSALSDPDFYHSCDTQTGSSGAPVFDGAGKLIGLHHLGKDEAPMCVAGRPEQNRAVRIEAILKDLRQNAPALHAELGVQSE